MDANRQHMIDVTDTHDAAEHAGDLEGIMATLVDNPQYLLPGGYVVEGQEAVRAFYTRAMAELFPRTMNGARTQLAVGESVVVVENEFDMTLPDGSVGHFRTVAVQPFIDGKMTGERVYASEGFERVMAHILER